VNRTLPTLAATTILLAATALAAPSASSTGDHGCDNPTVTIVDNPAEPAQWWNFSPNHNQGPLQGEPTFPTDPRGTWQGPHSNGGPAGDQTGTFQQGNGNGSWFHRMAATKAVTHEAPNPNYPCDTPEPAFNAYEVNACWTMTHSDGIENTYQFPQTRGCNPPPCNTTIEQQHDTYWIRDQAEADYYAGLTGLNSPADDAQLEPHGYYSVILTGGACEEPPLEQPPVTESPVVEPPVTQPPVVEPPSTVAPALEPANDVAAAMTEMRYTCDQKWSESYEWRNGGWVKVDESEHEAIAGGCDTSDTGKFNPNEEGF
jgi:hypothetical protein